MPVRSRSAVICWRLGWCWGVAVTLSPSMAIFPADGCSRKLRQRRKVLLPDPLRPIMTTTSRGITDSETPCKTCSSPNHLWSLSTVTIGSALISVRHPSLEPALQPGRNDRQKPVHRRRDQKHLHKLDVFARKPAGQKSD